MLVSRWRSDVGWTWTVRADHSMSSIYFNWVLYFNVGLLLVVNLFHLSPFLLTQFKSLTTMNSDYNVSLCSFFFNFLNFFKCPRVIPVACHVLFRDFFWIFKIFFKCPCVNPITCHVSKSMFYIQFGPHICYFCSI